MELTAQRDELQLQLQDAARVASMRTSLQSVAGIKLSAGPDGSALLTATDLEVSVRLPLSATVTSPGEVVLPARLVVDVIRALPSGEVTLKLLDDGSSLALSSARAKFLIHTLRPEDFPKPPEFENLDRIEIPSDRFVDALERVSRSASRDETRPVLTGVLLSIKDGVLTLAATDSYRLAVQTLQLGSQSTPEVKVNIPVRAMQELARLAQHSPMTSLGFGINQGQAVFELGGVFLSSRLIDGQFPNYEQLLPDSYEHLVKLPSNEILDAVKRIGLLAQKNSPIKLSFQDGELSISARTPDVGEASETLPIDFSGEELQIGFNPEFLKDGIESVKSEELFLKLSGPLRPGLIEPPNDTGFVYLVMPIRLNQ